MTDRDLPTRTEGEGETLDMPEGMPPFTQGQILGKRYQILEMLGRGGMGEVWKAFDLKLRVEVALKALRPEFFKSERRLELLRQEVRAAREVMSPNVCRIFDLIEVEGRELVSMEYVDGATLLGVLQERGPLELKEAQDIASQFLAGLEAIHKVGLIHRDIKPENIMLTRAGRVVVMDFGLARQDTEGGGSVSGTPAYMAPEQAAGQTLDARADVYAAGVVLAEMVSPDGIKSYESRQSLWEGVRSEPAKLPDSPWAPAIKRAVAKDREQRYHTAHTLTRALEDVTLRVEGAEDLHPYPGLASFTESDAEYFFGREAEVEQMWRRLERTHFLAIVGSSGAGKTSFIGAGLTPNAPNDWAIARCTPGNAAISSLRKTLIHELTGDTEALERLVDSDSPDTLLNSASSWRKRHGHALLVVDQFEEFFTQNTPEEQTQFATLVGRLVVEADVRVLLSMRDDFLIHCNRHVALRPLFSELTPLDPPTGAALRRAVTQPALKCGYRFEDDELVEEMLAEVEGERGALPMLAFAAARLWEMRDRKTGLLTRQAYLDIGGVGGALARHAEATIDRIGTDRVAIVRELFRNLVTADGTRAIREWDELLSIFSDSHSESPEEVLRLLIDARLLTSYEVQAEDEAPTRSVEIIHESLLANWPRLVRWQTQDQDGAQLRDELRQSARAWEEHGRHDDRLWTGTAFREHQVWRERYPGGLTDLEEAFGSAMTSLVTRRRRRRRIAAAAAFAVAVAVAAVFGTLWRRSVREARQAEAARLLSLGQLRLDKDPTEALAYAAASLELADRGETRTFAMKALWKAPPASVLVGAGGSGRIPHFSPDGTRLAAAGHDANVLVWPENDGKPLHLSGHTSSPQGPNRAAWTASGLLVTGHLSDQRVRIWSMPEGRLIRTIDFSSPTWWQVGKTHLLVESRLGGNEGEAEVLKLLRWKLPDGDTEDLGSINVKALGSTSSGFDPSGRRWVFVRGNTLYYRSLPLRDDYPSIVIGRHQNDARLLLESYATWMTNRADGQDCIWSEDGVTGERRCWSLSSPGLEPLEVVQGPPDPEDRRYAFRHHTGQLHIPYLGGGLGQGSPRLWNLDGLPGAEPVELEKETDWYGSRLELHPAGKWLVASARNWDQLVFWPLVRPYPSVVGGYQVRLWRPVSFSPDGEWLATAWAEDSLRIWSMHAGARRQPLALEWTGRVKQLVFDDSGERLLTPGFGDTLAIVPVDGGSASRLEGFSDDNLNFSAAFSPSGRLVAAGASYGTAERKALRVWDLETGEVQVFDLEPATPEDAGQSEGDSATGYEHGVSSIAFIDEATLVTAGWDGVRRWDLTTGRSSEMIQAIPSYRNWLRMSADRRTMFTSTRQPQGEGTMAHRQIHDLATGASQDLESSGGIIAKTAISPDGEVVATGYMDGAVRVGRIDGGLPHLLIGHDGPVSGLAISPDLQWIASSGQDETLRLWPMPDLSKPPLHTLPHDELIAKLHSLTNLRVVRDEDSAGGWKIEIGPFPGWAEVPEW